MHRRTHSGASAKSEAMSLHSSHVRSLVDSPGSTGTSGSDGFDSDTGSCSDDAFDGLSDGPSNALSNQAILLPLHKQQAPKTPRAPSSCNLIRQPKPKPKSVDADVEMWRSTLYQYQKENKQPQAGKDRGPEPLALSRQSTFESTSTLQSDCNDGAASVSASVRSPSSPARSRHSQSSPARSRYSLEDIDERSRYSSHSQSHSLAEPHSNYNAAAPLVLGAASIANANEERTQQRRNSNTLILQASTSASEKIIPKNATLQNFLSTVQLARPRLVPFSPLVAKEQGPQGPIITAASFAKQAPKAGYLSKLGTSVSEYKRRFFVLKPTTCLYYFLSPNDEEPRGCIDLDGFIDASGKSGTSLKVNSLGSLPDGRFRFEVVLPIQNNRDGEQQQNRKILLEARNEEIGKEWMQALTVERLSYSKATGELLKDQVRELEDEKKNLEERLDELRLVETDRDGAVEDAKAWRERSEKLDSALGVLKRWMSRSVDSDGQKAKAVNDSSSSEYSNDGEEESSNDRSSPLSISKDDQVLDEIELPGTRFASLANACRGLKENLRLTSIETSTALEDLQDSNQKLKAMGARMEKAETYVSKLWEETCSLRDLLKLKKNEKRILVNEVRALMEKTSADKEQIESLKRENKKLQKQCISFGARNNVVTNASEELDTIRLVGKRQLATPEKQLLFDLEEHVNSSLFQHEYLLDAMEPMESPLRANTTKSNPASSRKTAKKSNASADVSQTQSLPHRLFEPRDGDSSAEDDETDSTAEKGAPSRAFSPLRPKQLSLMDQAALDEAEEEQKGNKLAPILASPSSILLTGANLEVFDNARRKGRDMGSLTSGSGNLLDISDSSTDLALEKMQNPCGPSDLSSLKSFVTDNGTATSKLVCPLKDVTQSMSAHKVGNSDQSRVYSLMFYTPKIGLQFQKVPGNTGRSGVLTEAMTADVGEKQSDSATASSRTEAELRLIASLSDPNQTSKVKNPVKDQSCPVLLPKHYVLVCGFEGFDNTSNNRRPSLGARLVGFDGISIERGPWTFEAVHKAIKARGRPLTLTFRDDYLTTEQRSILTKAVSEVVQASNPPPRPRGRPANVPAMINAVTKASDRIAKSPSFSDISRDLQSHDDSTSMSNCSRSSDNWRNLSDAGTSSVFSSKFSPLVAGLMAGLSSGEKKRDEGPFTPEYFRRPTDSLDSISHHKEFKASLL